MAVTIKQIAARAGLSVPTVSRILNNDSELFRAETRARVLKAANELGYRPNSYRMALRTKKFNSIGLLFPANPLHSLLSCHTQCALLQEMQRRNQHLVAGQAGLSNGHGNSNGSDDDAMLRAELLLPKMLREWSVDGLLIDSEFAASPSVQELISRTSIPSIWLNVSRDADCVYSDDLNGVKEGTERLLKLGHRNIVYVDRPHHGMDRRREKGYRMAMESAGLPSHVFAPPQLAKPDRMQHYAEWLRSGDQAPTAVFCDDSQIAMAFYLAAVSTGISVPKDLSILTIHDKTCDELGVSVDAMLLPVVELAIQGLAALDEKIAKPELEVPPRALPLVYEQGVTLGPRRS